MPIDHVSFQVPKESFESTVHFYTTVLAPLGYKEMVRPVDNVVGLGDKVPDFWIAANDSAKTPTANPIHLAFSTMGKLVAFHSGTTQADQTQIGRS